MKNQQTTIAMNSFHQMPKIDDTLRKIQSSRTIAPFTGSRKSSITEKKFVTKEEFAKRLRSVDLSKISIPGYQVKERQKTEKL